jgi:hypothetical protein
MRNDARPIGEDSPASPVGGDDAPLERERPEARDDPERVEGSHKDDRLSPVPARDPERP